MYCTGKGLRMPYLEVINTRIILPVKMTEFEFFALNYRYYCARHIEFKIAVVDSR